jgi:hypothetical protein
MYITKHIIIGVLGLWLGLASCKKENSEPKVVLAQVQMKGKAQVQQPELQRQVPASTKLDSIRIRMKNEYARINPELVKVTPPKFEPGPKSKPQCEVCDISFLARISKQGEVSQQDFNYLLCTMDKKCRNNAEFLEFYNEELFRFVMRQPSQFLQGFMVDSSKWDLLAFELANPVSDEYSTDSVMQVLTVSNEQFKGKFRTPMAVLQQRMRVGNK